MSNTMHESKFRSDIVDPFVDLLMNGSLNRCLFTFRYSTYPVHRRENVAEHTFHVCMYSFLISKYLEYNVHDLKIDYAKLLTGALVHDLEESKTGDIIRSVKYSSNDLHDMLHESSIQFMKSIADEYGCEDLHTSWLTAKVEGNEGLIVKLADFLSVASYSISELNMGNRHMITVVRELTGYLLEFRRDLCQDYGDVIRYNISLIVSSTLSKLNQSVSSIGG